MNIHRMTTRDAAAANRIFSARTGCMVKTIWRYLILSAFVSYLFGLTIKPNEFQLHGMVAEMPDIIYRISSISVYLYLYGIGVFVIFLVCSKNVGRKRVPPPLLMFTFFYAYMILRIYFDGFAFEKVVVGLFGQIVLALFLIGYFSEGKYLLHKIEDFIGALSVWALIYTLMTFTSFLAGYGYLYADTSRFFGITMQPNTAGFHLAIASLSSLDCLVRRARGYLYRIVYIGVFLLSIYLCALTGSRGAISMCLVSCFIYLYLVFENSFVLKYSLYSIFALSAALILYLLNTNELIDNVFFNRMINSGDSRSEVWEAMLNALMSNPFFGAGVRVAGSESSFLKALATTGFIFGSLFLATVFSSAYYAYRMLLLQSTLKDKFTSLPLFLALLLALIWDGFLEGTLVEAASFGIFIFLVATQIIYFAYKNTPQMVRHSKNNRHIFQLNNANQAGAFIRRKL